MSCGPNKNPNEESSGGFFSWLFGDDSSSSKQDEQSKLCPGGCGKQNCNCNCSLREHLKECCGYGQLPPLITKDTCPVQKSAAVAPPPAKEECVFLPVDTTCKPSASSNDRPAATACSSGKAENKCPMPNSDLSPCVPTWLCPPTKTETKIYEAPYGAVILPISVRGRSYSYGDKYPIKCGQCGTSKTQSDKPAPKVANKECPMLRSINCAPDKKDEVEEGFFAKIKAFFASFGKK